MSCSFYSFQLIYPQYNLRWLLTGKGDMIKSSAPCEKEATTIREYSETELLRKLAASNEELLKNKNQEIEQLKKKITALENKIQPSNKKEGIGSKKK